jgi:protoheme IX farnesyltransferase
MGFAAHGWPGTWLLVATVIGMCLSSGGSSALNHWYDRDIDLLMTRTASRPVASGRIAARDALVIGNVLGLGGVLWLGIVVNWPAALWALAGFLCYVLVYTVWLKRTTPQNIVIGGAAGAIPPLVGWAAVTGRTDLAAVALFLIIFLWTPPHFWSLAIMLEDDYEAAGIPMLPVVRGIEETTRQIAGYAMVTVAVTFAMPLTGQVGRFYAISVFVLGALFVTRALGLMRTPTPQAAIKFFAWSNVYLMLVFVAVAVDALVR